MTLEEFLENEEKERQKKQSDSNPSSISEQGSSPELNLNTEQQRQLEFYANEIMANNPDNISLLSQYDPYEAGKQYADGVSGFIDTASRDDLVNYYRAYADGAARAGKEQNATHYWGNMIVLDRIKQKLGDTSALDFAGDFAKEIGYGVTGAITDAWSGLGYLSINLDEKNLNADTLYKIAKQTPGSNIAEAAPGSFGFSYSEQAYKQLGDIYQQFPNNKKVKELYDTVTKQGFNGDKKDFEKTVKYVNELYNKSRYDEFITNSGIKDVNASRKNLKAQEELGYGDVGKFVLDATGVVSNMVPSIVAGAATSGIASGAGASAAVAQGAQQGAALTSMGLSAGGNATQSALDEGFGWTSAGSYGTAVGAIEALTELIGGEAVNSLLFGHTVSTPAGKLAKQIADGLNLKSTLSRGLVAGFLDVNAEGFEEVLSQAIEPLLRNVILQDDTGWENYGEGLAQAYLDSIVPTLILGGIGKAQMSKEIDLYGKAYVNAIQESKSLTDAQKGEMIKGWEKAVKDAKVGFTENYTELKDSIMSQLEEADIKNIDTLTYALSTAMDENLTDEERRANIQQYAQEHGGIYNESQATSQELKDTATTKKVTYKGTDKIDLALNDFRIKNAGTTIETANEINNVQSTIKDLIERITGKQVVYVNPSSTTSKYYGFMNDDGNVYINSNLNAKDTLGAANHEIGHYVKSTNQELYDEFVSKANLTPEKIENYRGQVDDSLTDDQVKEEMFGDYIGEIMSKYKNTKAVEQSVLTLWDKVKRTAQDIGSTVLGTERQGRITDYNLSGLSYLEGDILNDTAFEQKVLDTFKSLKNVEQVKEATKKTKEITKANVKTPSDDVKTRIEEKYKAFDKKLVNMKTVKEMIANELETNTNDERVGKIYDSLKERGDADIERLRLSARKNDGDNTTKLSSRKTETNTERIINNQRNEIERLSTQADDLKEENKGLKKIIKGLKSTGRQQIRNVQSESNKMLKTGREQELKMKGQLEREGKKYNKLSEVAVDLKFENQLAEKARADGISFPREYKDLFIGLRRAGDSIKDAYATTRSIFDESQVVNKSIDNSINILKELRNRKIYNKLPNDIKAKINEYANIWAGSRKQSDLTLAKRVLNSLTARELRENGVNLTNAVRNQIMSEEGYGWENGKGSKSLQELFNGSKEVAQAFEQELIKLRQEVANFRARDMLGERTKELADTIIEIQDAVSTELGEKKGSVIKGLLKTNKTLGNSQMTLKTEIQALMGGNIHTPLMVIQDRLQKGEIRKKQAIVEVYKILSEFMQRSKGLNYALNTERWSPTLEKSLSIKSKFVDTGMSAYADNGKKINIKIPRSMMMSLAMHLLNQDNMAHISGAATRITTDESGNTHIEYGRGKGIRIPDEAMFRAGNEKDAYDRGVTARLTEEQVEGIANMLTDEEKAFVKAVSEVFKYTSELINEVSNRIVGYDMATVENYFPIRVWDKGESKGSVLNAPMQKMYGDTLAHMLNPGWLQERTTSFNPIYLENIGEVLNRVVNNVTNFYGYAEALRDNHILLDSVMPDGTEFGKSIDNLSSTFMTNYNRLTRFITGQESIRNGMFRNLMAANTLTFNVGTWLTQPMSFFNTIKYFSGKEFLSSLSPTNNNVKLNKMIRDYFDEIGIDHTEYNDYQVARAFIAMATPNLEHRAIGYKIPELNQLYNKSIEDKLGAHGIEAFDNIAVTAIARMMAYSVSLDPNIKFGSEEYFDVLGERLTQVLVETQPEFSQVNRANMFRSNNGVMRMLSLFGTPANQMMNNFMQSAMQVRYEAREGKVSQNAITSLAKSISGIVLSSALVGLVRALRDAIRDDDDETELQDRWIAQSIVALLGPTLILDDVAQFIMGQTKFGGMSSYDFNTPETTFMNGIQNLGEKIVQLGNGEVSPAKKTRDIIRAVGVITPIDTKDIVRFVEALMQFTAPDMYGAYQLQNNTTIYKQWLKNSDTDMATFYKAYTATRPKVLEEKYGYHKADKAKGIKSNLKEAREKALKDVLKNQKEVNKYMEILFDYKK